MTQATGLEHRTDGRTSRAFKTRDAVVEAMLELMREGVLRPTAKDISERAGVSLRSVFQHFEDLEELFATAADRQMVRLAELSEFVPDDLPYPERVERFVTARTRVLEAVSPVRRSAVLQEPFSPEIAQRLQWHRTRNRDELARVFASELVSMSNPNDALAALHAMTEWSAWETLRAHDGLMEEDARRVMALAIRSLLRKE